MTRRVMRLQVARKLATQALASNGVRRSLSQVDWDTSGGCQAPVALEFEGRPDTKRGEKGLPIAIVMETRCRRCAWCLRRRAWEWRVRCNQEIAGNFRTWFGTLTLSPQSHYMAMLRASFRLKGRGTDFEQLSASEQFSERHREIGYELTKWLKRVRKVSGAKLRFCLVVEAHKSGLPHYHVLVHQVGGEVSVTKRHLQDAWTLGFSNMKLVADGKAASYVTKYLHKSSEARVRASLHYGNPPPQGIASVSASVA